MEMGPRKQLSLPVFTGSPIAYQVLWYTPGKQYGVKADTPWFLPLVLTSL